MFERIEHTAQPYTYISMRSLDSNGERTSCYVGFDSSHHGICTTPNKRKYFLENTPYNNIGWLNYVIDLFAEFQKGITNNNYHTFSDKCIINTFLILINIHWTSLLILLLLLLLLSLDQCLTVKREALKEKVACRETNKVLVSISYYQKRLLIVNTSLSCTIAHTNGSQTFNTNPRIRWVLMNTVPVLIWNLLTQNTYI